MTSSTGRRDENNGNRRGNMNAGVLIGVMGLLALLFFQDYFF
jgi:hypothetical protein